MDNEATSITNSSISADSEYQTLLANISAVYAAGRFQAQQAMNVVLVETIFTPELLPNDCRRTARNLGNLYHIQQGATQRITHSSIPISGLPLAILDCNHPPHHIPYASILHSPRTDSGNSRLTR